MKRILVYAPHDYSSEPSFRIRLLAIVQPLARRGFELVIQSRPSHPWGRMQLARWAREFDAVVLHRKMLDPYEVRILRRSLAHRGAKLILDIDDATMLHERPLGFLARRRLDRRFAATTRILSVACAGNAHLARAFEDRGIKTEIIPSAVNPAAYAVKTHTAGDALRLVWIGSHSTIKYLEESFPALGSAAQRVRHLRLIVICDVSPQAAPVPLEFVPWSLEGEVPALLKGDIGIAPTPENPWTRGKCGFKIVQYMAAGLPVIASPVGFNADLVQPAGAHSPPAGLLPTTWSDWPAAIEQLAGDPARRAQFGAAGRSRVERELSLEIMADRWARVLTD